jgi:peptide-methionine (S)-S-oxide reductase
MIESAKRQPGLEASVESGGETAAERTETATVGAGCFWQVEGAFRDLPGVLDTAVGYEGGDVDNPSYEQVCSDRTGHAEVCEITFDPERISYEELVDRFWEIHDPTQVDRQGPDVGRQYRSVIFFHGPEQEAAAHASKERAQGRLDRPIATEIEPAQPFWRAEEYHQCYLQKRSEGGVMGVLRSALGS